MSEGEFEIDVAEQDLTAVIFSGARLRGAV